MTAATVPQVYASALLELADERDKRASVVEDCSTVAEVFARDPQLLAAIRSPVHGRGGSKELLRRCFDGRVADEVRDLLQLLVDRGRLEDATAILAEVEDTARRQAGEVAVESFSAVELDEQLRGQLEASLRRHCGEGVRVAYHVDAELKGGLTLRLGDVLVDGSVRRYLAVARARILQAPISRDLWEGDPRMPSGGQ